MAEEESYPLFETRRAKGRVIYTIFSLSLFVGILFIWVYRVSHIPREGEDGKWAWIGLLCAELWFGLYWLLRHPFRWNPVFREPFRHKLSQRYHTHHHHHHHGITLLIIVEIHSLVVKLGLINLNLETYAC